MPEGQPVDIRRGSWFPRTCRRCGKESRKHNGLRLRSGDRSWMCRDVVSCQARMARRFDRCPRWLRFFRRTMAFAYCGAFWAILISSGAFGSASARFQIVWTAVWCVWLVLGTAGKILA